MFNVQQLSDIAHGLKAGSGGQDIAVAEDAQSAGAIYYAKRAPRVKEPYSAAVKLIQIGKNKKWKFAKRMVSTAGSTEMCLGMAGLADLDLSFALTAGTTPVALPGKTAPTVAHTLVTKITEAHEGVWEERDKDLALV
ncbi:MAG: hypothetical protein M3Y57_11910 [Acidobacteriota bacterium]|nr:hypothetical protein [Acidobacteriota bacterium]